jgi:hypothetical protein
MITDRHPSELVLDALHLGALDEEARAATVAHTESCAACRERVRIAEESRRRFVEHVLPRQLPAIVGRRQRSIAAWLVPPLVAVAAAVGYFVVRANREAPASELGIKGGPVLQIYARHDEQVVTLQEGMTLEPGDRIRFVVKGGASQHLLVTSIDAAGTATVYYPYGGSASARLPDAPVYELPGSVILDHTLGPERVYAFFARKPIAAAPVLAALRDVGARGADAIRAQLTLAVDVEMQLSLRFEKVP